MRQAARLDELGVGFGDRVAIVSQNSARLRPRSLAWPVTAAYWCRSTSACVQTRCATSSSIPAPACSIVDPELEESLADVSAEFTFVIGNDDDLSPRRRTEPRPGPGRERHCVHQLHLGHHGPTQGRPDHPPQRVDQRGDLRAHAGVSDRDVYLHTLPMFDANGWGIPSATAGMGVTQVVIRKIDGAEILRRVERHGVTFMCAAPAVVAAVLDAAAAWDGPIPGRDRVRIIVAGAPPPSRTVARVEEGAGLGVHPDLRPHRDLAPLTINRTRSEWDDLSVQDRASNLVAPGTPAHRRDAGDRADGRRWRGPTSCWKATGNSPRRRPPPCARLVPHR